MSRALITVDTALERRRGGWLSTDVGTYHHEVTMALAKKRAGRITSVRDITRVQYGRITDCMEIYVRGRIWKAVNLLLEEGVPAYPIYDPDGHHKVIGIKVVRHYTEEDMDALDRYLDMAIQRNEIALGKIDLIRNVMAALRKQLTAGGPSSN